MNVHRRKSSAIAFVAAAVLLATAVQVHADTPEVRVLRREMLGRYIEDIDFVPPGSGALSNHIVILNGFEVHGLPANAESRAIHKLFDLREQDMTNPTGITYLPSEGLFAVIGDGQPFPWHLSLVDHQGRTQASREIRFLGEYWAHHFEGLAYVPPTSARYPNHLLTITWNFWEEPFAHVQVIRPDGQVVAQLPLPDNLGRFAYGVSFLAPDRILVGTSPSVLTTLDFDGNVLGTVVTSDELQEGIVQLPDTRVVIGDGARLRLYDAALGRLPKQDRDLSTPGALVFPTGVAWDPDRGRHLVAGRAEAYPLFAVDHVTGVPPSLREGTIVFPLYAHIHGFNFLLPRMTYLPDEHRIAASFIRSYGPQDLALFDDAGEATEFVDVSAVAPPYFPIVKITYVPNARQFVMVATDRLSTLRFLSRTGVLVRDVDLAPIGVDTIRAVAYFDPAHPSGGQFLIFDDNGRAVVTDFNGNALREFDYRRALGLVSVVGASAITTGPEAGAFTALEGFSTTTLVVFRLE